MSFRRTLEEWTAADLAREKAKLAELDTIEEMRDSGGITDAEADSLRDDVMRRLEEENEALRGPRAELLARYNRFRWVRMAAIFIGLLAFYYVVWWLRMRAA